MRLIHDRNNNMSEEEIKFLVGRVVKSSTAELTRQISDLTSRLKRVEAILEYAAPSVREALVGKAEKISARRDAAKKEEICRSFFCNDNGLLYRISEFLGEMSSIGASQSTGERDLDRCYGRYVSGLFNLLIIADKDLASVGKDEVDLSAMSLDGLMSFVGEAEDLNVDADDFYSSLWDKTSGTIRKISSDDYENAIIGAGFQTGYRTLLSDLIDLVAGLRDGGVEIIATPDDGRASAAYFKTAASSDTVSRPLVRRASDGSVYSFGLLNPEKPYAL